MFVDVYSDFKVPEVFKKLPGGRGFVLTGYEPVGSHGDPVNAFFYTFRTHMLCPNCPISPEQQNNLLHTFPPQSIVSRAGETT